MAAKNPVIVGSKLALTPSRKRKREFEKYELTTGLPTTGAASCFTNAAFSSTPKRLVESRRSALQTTKENTNCTNQMKGVCLEVKSIADIARDAENRTLPTGPAEPKFPYEVVRKPPKKKKRPAEAGCFENVALNLELPEKQFNPFEVVRGSPNTMPQRKDWNCFVNAALNLRGGDTPALRNPFEIQRFDKKSNTQPIESRNLQIALPFAPTVNCRLDFEDLSLSQLTPSKLLAEKLVFSPVAGPKRSLGSVSEESTMDIGKELDRYQLELENSINEAKLRKSVSLGVSVPARSELSVEDVEVDKKVAFSQKLEEIAEDDEEAEELGGNKEIGVEAVEATRTGANEEEVHNAGITQEQPTTTDQEKPAFNVLPKTERKKGDNSDIFPDCEDLDELYGEGEDNFDFKTAAPFVRAYRGATSPKRPISRDALKRPNASDEVSGSDECKKHLDIRTRVRKSIRKLVAHSRCHKDASGRPENAECEKSSNFITTIRQSLRRKPAKALQNEVLEQNPAAAELSIIDTGERTMKLKANVAQTEYVKIEELSNEKKYGLRNSIRCSTREVRHQFMKSVFHRKQEEYDFKK